MLKIGEANKDHSGTVSSSPKERDGKLSEEMPADCTGEQKGEWEQPHGQTTRLEATVIKSSGSRWL